MDTPAVIANDPGIIQADDEIEIENTESTPSAARQEVNKQSEEVMDTVNNVEISCENENLNARTEPSGASPKKAMKRNVSFPPDSPVTGSLEPPDPWKNVPNWKTEDLLRAYKAGCEKHGTKPLNKIIQQLTCIENVGERYEILSLKGERLDIRQSESLEEIFKHVRFRCIDLEATHLDDETSVAIFDMVEYYESACKLNISFNKNIGPRGWQACSKLIRKTPCLTFIDAKNCDLNERVMPILGRSLRMGCYLTRLHLQSVGLAGRALVILVAALKMNETLKELFIGDNKLMSTDGVQVGNLLKFNHKLELLDLRNNHLQDVGAHHVCEGLSEQTYGSGLLTLVLWNNQISFQAMSDISHALMKTDSLETLNLGHNPITNEGIHLVKDGLLKSKSLLKLGLSGTKVTCEGAVALAEVIADTSRIVRLDLQENDIKTAGLMALSLALKVNKSMSRLDLDKDTKKEQGIKDYAEQQRRLQQDIKTYLERNRDLAHKQLREQENVSKVENKTNEDQAGVKTDEGVVVDFEVNGDNGESENVYEDNESKSAEHSYIPTDDKISRPKLLFLHEERSRESDLESPESIAEDFSVVPSLEQPEMLTLTLPLTSGQDLLSPQYCPKMKAKKLFSVTRVTSPTLASPTNPLLDAKNQSLSVPHLCTPLSTVPVSSPIVPLTIDTLNLNTSSQVEVDSCLIQQKLEIETYLKDLVHVDKGSTELGANNEEASLESFKNVEKWSEVADFDKTVNADKGLEDTVCDEKVKTNDADTLSSEIGTNRAATDPNKAENDLTELLQDDILVGEGPCLKETAELGGQTVCEKSDKMFSDIDVNMLSAGDGPIKPSDNDTATINDGSATETVSHYADDSYVSSENVGKSGLSENNADDPAKTSVFEINGKLTPTSEVCDVTVDNEYLNPEFASINENSSVIPDNSLAVDHLKNEKTKQLEESNVTVADSNSIPTSLTVNASDDQLDSIEIIPESDINESKCVPDLNEELPELLDCDSNDDITNNAYCGLTDSLCDLVLPFELENGNTTEDAIVNSLNENKLLNENAKTFSEAVNSNTNGHNVDSGMVDNDSEQWNKVEKSDVCDKNSVQDNDSNVIKTANKPDFHTSLSLNGLKQELADLIDDDANLTKSGMKNVLQKVASPEDIIPTLVTNEEENCTQKSNGVVKCLDE